MARKPSGFTAVMARRHEPPHALDFFPTPPWATRALFRHVLPILDVKFVECVWEPACGEGHMATVIAEFTNEPVIATDIFDYGYGVNSIDFLDTTGPPFTRSAQWIVTNPPFRLADQFALRAFDLAHDGVALLLRTQWLEGEERYRSIFRDHPPSLLAPFTERVPMLRGRWDPHASTATAYSWFVWRHGFSPRPPFWIPPGCRRSLTHPDDRRRFARAIELEVSPLFSPSPSELDASDRTKVRTGESDQFSDPIQGDEPSVAEINRFMADKPKS